MKLVSWNVNGLRSLSKEDYWKKFLKLSPDIFGLQEIKAEEGQLTDEFLKVEGYTPYIVSCETKKGYSGVAMYSRITPLSVYRGMGIKEFDQEGRIVGGEFEDFHFINVYFPNGGGGPERLDYKFRFYDAFLLWIDELRKTKPVIFCGDVNTAHEEIDLARPKENEENTGFLPEERAWIDEVVLHGYIDTYRHFNPSKTGMYSYWDMKTRARDRNVGWRIDYFFVSNELKSRLQSVSIENTVYGSDHCPVVLTLS